MEAMQKQYLIQAVKGRMVLFSGSNTAPTARLAILTSALTSCGPKVKLIAQAMQDSNDRCEIKGPWTLQGELEALAAQAQATH